MERTYILHLMFHKKTIAIVWGFFVIPLLTCSWKQKNLKDNFIITSSQVAK
jgi:hypothetical protein